MKSKNAQAQHGTAEHEQSVYEEALVPVSKEDIIKMGENVAYGPVVR